MDIYTELIEALRNDVSKNKFMSLKRELCTKYGVAKPPTNFEILLHVKKQDLNVMREKLQLKPVRTVSGVTPVAIMTKPYPCPHGKCSYCPGGIESAFGEVPQSYVGKEPTTMRAIRNKYDPYLQVFNRLEQYAAIGHNHDKVELIIMGGTFPSLPTKYQNEFVAQAFAAMNDFGDMFEDFETFKQFFELPGDIGSKERTKRLQQKILNLKKSVELETEQERNETAKVRCTALCIETRPDWGMLEHGTRMLEQGCTRVEIGVQSVYGDVLKKVERGHSVKDTEKSFQVLKDLGFKISAHYMPGLPLTTRERDIKGFKELFSSRFAPDMIKIYPCMVAKGTKLYEEWVKGEFVPINAKEAAERIVEMKKSIPKYCRVQRVQRDVPTKMLEAGVEYTNLRQYIHENYDVECKCIRCREPMGSEVDWDRARIDVTQYKANKGREFFISIEDGKYILGFCRLRFPYKELREETEGSAIVRELHVYGQAAKIGTKGVVQHKGVGKKLLEKAQEIALHNGKSKMVVISGVGAREYYRKQGYSKDGVYMSKILSV